MSTATMEEIEAALDEARQAPAGPARSARVERLVELAAQTGDRPLIIRTLQELINAYEYGGERDKILVPFARVLRMWDENSADFDGEAAYGLHWYFKWVTGGMIVHPNVPLATIHRWLDEMASRYRQAGYQPHAVYAQRHHVAAHTGDREAARRALDDWLSADRDAMSDCHACERSGQGDWYAELGEDQEALRVWEPVLAGELTCAEEPHRVLAKSLLPLMRQNRPAEARANHLRGYRMVRGNPNLREYVGRHIEFCALTGNEARGLEILAEHTPWLSPGGENAADRLSFLEAVAVLLRRLRVLGQDNLSLAVPGAASTTTVEVFLPTVEREVADLTRRFDERNGTTAVSERARARLNRPPLTAQLNLGVRSPLLAATATTSASEAPSTAESPEPPKSLDELFAEATALSDRRHPDAASAWERVASAGVDLPPRVAVRVAESRALEIAGIRPAEVRAAFVAVAEEFARLDEPALAVLNRARAALAALLGSADPAHPESEAAGAISDGVAVVAETAAALDEITSLHTAGRATPRQLLAVNRCRLQALFHRWVSAEGGPLPGTPEHSDLVAALRDGISKADEFDQPYDRAMASLLLAKIGFITESHAEATGPLTDAAAGFVAADAPWEAVEPLAMLAELALGQGSPDRAEEHARAALAHGGGNIDPGLAARLVWLVAEACWRRGGRDEEVIDHACEAAQRLDQISPPDAARVRWLAARAYHRLGRPAEASALFETVVPEIERAGDEVDTVNAQRGYGRCLHELGEHQQAAELLLKAISATEQWPNQTAHAALAHEVGDMLRAAGLIEQAERSFGRAAELWRELGEVLSQVRAVRARAWAMTAGPEPAWTEALAIMDEAVGILPATLDLDEPDAAGVAYERAETQRQLAQLILRWDGPEAPVLRGVSAAETASAGFFELDEFGSGAVAELIAAELETERLGQVAAAVTRLEQLRRAGENRGEDAVVKQCERRLRLLAPGSQGEPVS